MNKMMIRPKEGRKIWGVCAAMANYFNMDVSIVRLIWVLLLLPGGFPGVLGYIICAIVIPSE